MRLNHTLNAERSHRAEYRRSMKSIPTNQTLAKATTSTNAPKAACPDCCRSRSTPSTQDNKVAATRPAHTTVGHRASRTSALLETVCGFVIPSPRQVQQRKEHQPQYVDDVPPGRTPFNERDLAS